MRERIISAVKAWKTGATLAQIRGKVKFNREDADAAGVFYEALDGLVEDGSLVYNVETMVYREGEGK